MDDQALNERLLRERPVPRAGFRAQLRATLRSNFGAAPPQRLRWLIGTYAATGAALLLVLVLGVAGAGPLAA
jgi:hypothetical protein